MACSDQISTTDLENASLDAKLIAEVATSRTGGVSSGALISQTSNRFGETTSTTRGQLDKIAYEPPVSYAGSIAFTVDDGAKTIERSGIIYAPLISSLPLTTTGTWSSSDEDNFYAIQIANTSAFGVNAVSSMVAMSLKVGSTVSTKGYYAEGDGGQASYLIVAPQAADEYGDHTLANGNVAVLQYSGKVDVKKFGVKADGAFSDYAPLSAAATKLKNTGNVLSFVSGNMILNTDLGSIEVEGFIIEGPKTYAPVNDPSGSGNVTDYGAVFSITGITNSPFLIGRGGQIRGVNFWYPDQVTTSPPTVYPTTLLFDYSLTTVRGGNIQGVVIEDCTFYNPYTLMDVGPSGTGSSQGFTHFRNNKCYPLRTGIIIRSTATPIHILDNDWTPAHWVASSGTDVEAWVAENGVIMDIQNGDNLFYQGNTCFGFNRGLYYNGATATGVNMQMIVGNVFDGTRFPIECTGNVVIKGMQLVGNVLNAINFKDATDFTCAAVKITNPASKVKITMVGNRFGPTAGHHIIVSDSSGTVDGKILISGNEFENAGQGDATSTQYESLRVNAATMDFTVTSNHFFSTSGRLNNVAAKVFISRSLDFSHNISDAYYQILEYVAGDDLIFTNNIAKDTKHPTATYTISNGVTNKAHIKDNIFDKNVTFYTFTNLDTTPSVSRGDSFIANNSAATTITFLDNGQDRDVVRIKFQNGNTTIDFTGTNLKGNSGANWNASNNDHMTCWFDGTVWYCDVSNN
tara:strand:- start:150 stop:2381 length:2232 start_codon:yes stop_codon:yes gene_type:complete